MSIKRSYLLIIIFALTFFILSEFISFYLDYQTSKEDIYKNDKSAIHNLINAQENNLKMLATLLSNDKAVIEAYEKDDPLIIINHIEPIWDKMRQEHLIYEIHFFKPPAISFVNFSNFNSIGKDVSDARKDILWVTSSFHPSTHNLMCKTYAGIRATYPILGEHHKLLGGLSLGKKIDWLPEAVKENTSRDSFLVYTKKSAQTLDPKYYKHFMEDKTVVGDYIFATSTLKSLKSDILKKIDFNKEMQYLKHNHQLYILDKYPILDFSKKILGYIFVLNDVKPLYMSYLKSLSLNFLLILITATLIFFITRKALGEFNAKLQKSLNDLNFAQKSAKMGSYLYNVKTGNIQWSKNHYELFDVTEESFHPTLKNFMYFVHHKDRSFVTERLEYAIDSKKPITFDYRIILKNSKRLYVRSTAMIIEKENQLFLSGTIQDITDQKLLELENQKKTKQLSKQLYTDELTKLPNRRALVRDMKEYTEATLAIINIKSFKNINDVFGFEVGNFTLQTLAEKLRFNTKEYKLLLYRIGSDEFAILNKEISNKTFEDFVANTITQVEHEAFFYLPKEIEINISIYAGICFSTKNRLACADVALSEANKYHKDYIIYSSSENLIEEQEHKLSMIKIIKNAIKDNKILLYGQPIVDKDQNLYKYETLVRLEYNDEILSPFHFLEIAKKTKYYPLITRIVVHKALEVFKDRKEQFSINLIAEDILNESTLAYIRKEILSFKDKERIVFEIVESEDIYQIEEVANFIKEMQSLGIKIAIDDFGTGYSNFSYLLELQPDYIKIDGSLIKDLDTNKNAKNIVTTIITFAQELHCKTVAEYIHSKEIFEICKELGVDEFQGYYFSEPKLL